MPGAATTAWGGKGALAPIGSRRCSGVLAWPLLLDTPGRESNNEGCSLSFGRVEVDAAAMLSDDGRMNLRQSLAGALPRWASGEERVEHASSNRIRNTDPVILHTDLNQLV